MSYDQIGTQFVDFYYQTFDSNRAGLASLYRDSSMLSFEGSQTAGAAPIVAKLVGLPFNSVAHRIVTKDFQPVGSDIVVLVTGQLLIDGESNAQQFSQTFYLKNDNGNYFIQNDVFRLIYG
ncbi:Nuclear transport factor 2 [Podila minutissima]|uniref:Nuclear transport factor 2 n=1 Tax=Podila minutissima TaxID=64525 RepID=A0A9P5SFZ8_9FUNG|nr:Nuclear transport factor 2 [Podila minutissima]